MNDQQNKTTGDAAVMRLWREVGLPEYFLGNGGTNHKLVAFAKACFRQGHDDALEAACGAVAAVAIETNRPECCNCPEPMTDEFSPPSCCGNPNLLVTAYDVAKAIRALKEVV